MGSGNTVTHPPTPDDESAHQPSPAVAPPETARSAEAMKARSPRLEAGLDCGAALAQSVETGVRQVLWNWDAALSGGDEECVHQMRVALRRLRVALKVFKAEREDEVWHHLGAEAKALIGVVGEVRDLDVLVNDVVGRLYDMPERPDLGPLLTVLDDTRKRARLRLVEALATLRWVDFRSRLALWPMQIEQRAATAADSDTLDRSARKVGLKELRRLWKRIDEASAAIDALDIEQRHTLRKDLRKLRYAVDLLAPLHEGHDAGRMVTEIRRLQVTLGHLNDLATAQTLVDMPAIRDHAEVDVQRAVGFVLGWHAAKGQESWRETKAGLARLRKCEPFWE